ncbi:MAG: hypothetical protein ACLURV_05960 [Gallintestinimicrobium sp.]
MSDGEKDKPRRYKDEDKNGNQLYCKDGDTYREATTADYYTKDKFYRKKANVEYRYTGWQTIDGKRFL